MTRLLVQAGEGSGVHAIFPAVRVGCGRILGNARVNAFGAVGKTVLAGTDAGIYVSDDDGRSWPQMGGVARRIVGLATVGKSVFAATHREGLFVSADEGWSWRSLGFPVKRLRSLLADRGRLFVGTEGDGVLVSGDEGRTWESGAAGLPAAAQIFALAAVGDRVFAGLYAKRAGDTASDGRFGSWRPGEISFGRGWRRGFSIPRIGGGRGCGRGWGCRR